MFILSLAIADLIVGLTVMPISSVYVLTGDWIFGVIVCQIWLVIDYTASTASIFNLLILSLDRYWSIRSPLKYLCKRTKKRALGMIVIVWILSASWMIPIVGWHEWDSNGVRKHPSTVCETEFSDNVIFKLTTSSVNFFIPMTLMVVLYIKIYREIKRRGEIDIGRCSVSVSYSANGKGGKIMKKFKKELERDDPLRSSASSFSMRHTTKELEKNKEIAMITSKSSLSLESKCKKDEITESCVDEEKCSPKFRSSVNTVDDCFSDSSVKRYQKLTIVKPENASFAFEDYKDIEVKVKYINGGSQGMISECLHNKQEAEKQISDRSPSKDVTHCKHKEKLKSAERNTAKQWFVSAKSKQKTNSDKCKQKIIKVEGCDVKVCASVYDENNSCELSREPTTSSFNRNHQNHHHVLRKVESSRLRQEKKAARQLGVILGAFLACWLPYVVVFIVTAYCSCISHFVHTIVVWLGYVNSTVNPFLYALCNDNFKNAFRKLLARSTPHGQNTFETVTHGTSFRVSRTHENQCFS